MTNSRAERNTTLHLFGEEEAQAQRAAGADPEGCRRQNLLIPMTFELRPLIKACELLCCPGKRRLE